MSALDAGVRLVLVLVLGYAAVTKANRPAFAEFAESLRPLTGTAHQARLAATLVLVGEVACVGLLVVPATGRVGLLGAGLLLATYALGIELARRRGLRMTCRCFGGQGSVLGRAEVVRNAVLAGLALLALVVGPNLPTASGPQLLVTGTIAGLLALTVVRWDDLAFLLNTGSRA